MIHRFLLLIFPWLWATCGIGGSSSSSNATTTTYNTTDKRIAAGEGSRVLSAGGDLASGDLTRLTGDNNRVESLSDEVVSAAFQYAANRDALAGETLDNVFAVSRDLYGQAASAYEIAQTAPAGRLTERTIVILAALGLGLGVLVLRNRRG